jgi:hypothetical protein
VHDVPAPVVAVVAAWRAAGSPPQPAIAWPRHRWQEAFPEHAPWLDDLPAEIDREDVRHHARSAASGEEGAVRAFLAAMAWGYGRVGYGPWRSARILRSRPDAAMRLHRSATALRELGALEGYELLAATCRLQGLGPAFGTKYLAFCPQPAEQPHALILDRLVADWLRRSTRLSIDPVPWSPRGYARYLDRMRSWAAAAEVTPEELEQCIFRVEASTRGGQWSEEAQAPRSERRGNRMTARLEILDAARALTARGQSPFSPQQLIQEVQRRGTQYAESTLRTHIVSAMCVNAPEHHAVRYPDLYRVDRGQYVLHQSSSGAS